MKLLPLSPLVVLPTVMLITPAIAEGDPPKNADQLPTAKHKAMAPALKFKCRLISGSLAKSKLNSV